MLFRSINILGFCSQWVAGRTKKAFRARTSKALASPPFCLQPHVPPIPSLYGCWWFMLVTDSLTRSLIIEIHAQLAVPRMANSLHALQTGYHLCGLSPEIFNVQMRTIKSLTTSKWMVWGCSMAAGRPLRSAHLATSLNLTPFPPQLLRYFS